MSPERSVTYVSERTAAFLELHTAWSKQLIVAILHTSVAVSAPTGSKLKKQRVF
jgi:hypothetical protein